MSIANACTIYFHIAKQRQIVYHSRVMGEAITNIFSTLFEVWKEMFSAFWDMIPKMLNFVLWILAGIIILPCVYVAGTLFPMWTEWGEDL
jgi:hypothetical protein